MLSCRITIDISVDLQQTACCVEVSGIHELLIKPLENVIKIEKDGIALLHFPLSASVRCNAMKYFLK